MLSLIRGPLIYPVLSKLCRPKSFKKGYKMYSSLLQKSNPNTIKFTIFNRNGEKVAVSGEVQDTILDAVIDNELEIESFGVCEGCTACSTCHVILPQKTYDHILKKSPPSYEELDMLDLAYGLTATSRLGCQVELCKEMEGIDVALPPDSTDARS